MKFVLNNQTAKHNEPQACRIADNSTQRTKHKHIRTVRRPTSPPQNSPFRISMSKSLKIGWEETGAPVGMFIEFRHSLLSIVATVFVASKVLGGLHNLAVKP